MASCTTNCLAPLAKVLDDEFGIKKGFMTTVHGYTSSQNIVDGPHKRLRRGRAGAFNIVPTTSGATEAVVKVIPSLKGKLDGLAMRVPVICGSIVDFVVEVEKRVSADEVNKVLKDAARGKLRGILDFESDEIVSSDVIGDSASSIVDGSSTQAMGNLVKVLSWYDNEYGYSCRMVELIKRVGRMQDGSFWIASSS
jgi:glyceraldehyde 3-phosphate dehydrogenase